VVYRDVSWVKPIYFQEPTKEWLMANRPWPPEALEDFDRIAKHNQKYEEILGQARRTATQPTSAPASQ
jgi:hypothetical protein